MPLRKPRAPVNPAELFRELHYVVRDIAPEVASIYKFQLDRLLNDLMDRIKRRRLGLPFGGGQVPQAVMRDLYQSIEGLRRGLMRVSPKMGAYVAEKMHTLILPSERAFLATMTKKAPGWVVASGEMEKMGAYLQSGSLLRRKVMARIGTELMGTKGRSWSEAVRLLGRQKAPIPIHWRLLPQTQQRLHFALKSGMSQTELIRYTEKSFGIDWLSGHRHPAHPHPITGRITDPTYGMRKGFNVPTNPNGVMSDIKRLIRTEGSEAHNAPRMAGAKANPLIIGIRYLRQDNACDDCIAAFPMGRTIYFKDTPNPEVPPIHPNDFCTVSGYEYMPLSEAKAKGLLGEKT